LLLDCSGSRREPRLQLMDVGATNRSTDLRLAGRAATGASESLVQRVSYGGRGERAEAPTPTPGISEYDPMSPADRKVFIGAILVGAALPFVVLLVAQLRIRSEPFETSLPLWTVFLLYVFLSVGAGAVFGALTVRPAWQIALALCFGQVAEVVMLSIHQGVGPDAS